MKEFILFLTALFASLTGNDKIQELVVDLATSSPIVIEQATITPKTIKIVKNEVKGVVESIKPIESTSTIATTTIEQPTYIAEVIYIPEPKVVEQVIEPIIEQVIEPIAEPITDKSQILLRDCNTKRTFKEVLYLQENGETQFCFLVLNSEGKATHNPMAIVSDETGKEFQVWSNSKGRVYDDNGNKFNGETFTPFYLSVLDYNATSSHTINIKTDNGLNISQNIFVE